MRETQQVIGFTTKFYTLWEVSDPYIYWINSTTKVTRVDYTYKKNLSFDLEKAKAKLTGEFKIDETLRGSSSFYVDTTPFEFDEFSFGKLKGQKILQSNDLWYLNTMTNGEFDDFRRKLAFLRLLELGIDIVEYNGDYITRQMRNELIHDDRIKNLETGHFFNNGEKVEVELKTIKSFWFDGMYGGSCLVEYESVDGKKYKYLGSSPIELDEFTKVSGTVKHSNYRGKDETRLIRIKILK